MRGVLGAALLCLMLAAPARAELAVGLLEGSGEVLVTFDTGAPGQFTSMRAITGLEPGDDLLALDYRHFPLGAGATPAGLYGLGVLDTGGTDSLRLYRIDQGTGVATVVGPLVAGVTDGTDFGADFNPQSDRLRVVNDADASLRINPNTAALAGSDTALNPNTAEVEAVAYDRIDADTLTPTTLFGLNVADHTLVTIGGVDGSPSANGGTVITVGGLGITTSATGARNLDISPSGTAYLSAIPSISLVPSLYTLNLATGAATLIGALPASLLGLAVVPAATVQLAAAEASVTEGATATLTVTRSGAASGTATVAYATRAVTASGDDFTDTEGTVTFGPEETSRTIDVATAADTVDEPDATLTVTISGPNATTSLGSPASATVTIVDDDPAPVVSAPDVAAPSLTLSGIPRKVKRAALLRRGVRVRVTPSEAVALDVALLGTARRARLRAADNLTLARRVLKLAAGARTVRLKPSRGLVGRPRKDVRLRVRVIATDAAGNRRTVRRSLVLVPR